MMYHIREIKPEEYPLLDGFLYEAIFVPEGTVPPERSIILLPELQVYIDGFGTKKDDICFVVEVNDQIVGAVWVRDMLDYGHLEDGVHSFAISLYPEFRAQGIGTALMSRMLQELTLRGYKKASLSVQKKNQATKLYQRLGFDIVDEKDSFGQDTWE